MVLTCVRVLGEILPTTHSIHHEEPILRMPFCVVGIFVENTLLHSPKILKGPHRQNLSVPTSLSNAWSVEVLLSINDYYLIIVWLIIYLFIYPVFIEYACR